MKKNPFKISLCLLAAASLLTGCASPGTVHSDASGEDSDRQQVNFSDMTYEHYDPSELEAMILDENDLLSDPSASAEAVLSGWEAITDEYQEVLLNYSLAEIAYYQDITVQANVDEYDYMNSVYTDLEDQIGMLGSAILASDKSGDSARKDWDPDETAYFESYTAMTQAQKDLQEEEADLIVRYDTASLQEFTVSFNGKDYTADELYYDEDISNADYQRLYSELTKKEADTLGPIYIELVKVRQQLAESFGYDSYPDYAYASIYGRDYSPSDALTLSEEVKTYFPELYEASWEQYAANDNGDLDACAADMTEDEQLSFVSSHLDEISPSLTEAFTYMTDNDLYDIGYSDSKLATSYTTMLNVCNEPYLFLSPTGCFYDLMTLVHEFGHFNAYYENYKDSSFTADYDLAEIHSQGLEFLFTAFYNDLPGEDYETAATDYTLYQKICSILEGCMIDEFEQKVYALDDPSLNEINAIYTELSCEYGFTDAAYGTCCDWAEIPHIYESPCYYISYAVSALPAAMIWETSLTDYASACETYLSIVSEGERGDYQEVLGKCGLDNPFEEGISEKLADKIRNYLNSQ